MGSVTKVGILFAEPYNRPLSTAAQFQSGCYLLFFVNNTTTLAPVYRDPTLIWPYKQTSIPGSGVPSKYAVQSGVVSDGIGRFTPIYLNPAIEYSYQLYSSAGALLESGTAVNLSNATVTLKATKISTTTRALTTTLTNDPDLQISVPAAGAYRIEADLNFFAVTSASTVEFEIAFSQGVPFGTTMSTMVLLGNGTQNYISLNTATASQALSTTAGQNFFHISGTVVVSGEGTFSIKWAQGTSSATALTSLGAGSALYVTPLI